MTRTAISTGGAPAAIGPYSQGIDADGLVFCSGQLGLDPATGELVEGVAAQAERSLRNLSAVLDAAGLGWADVAKVTIFLAGSMEHFAAVNERYAAALGAHWPARSTIAVAALPLGAAVEIEAIVHLPQE